MYGVSVGVFGSWPSCNAYMRFNWYFGCFYLFLVWDQLILMPGKVLGLLDYYNRLSTLNKDDDID